MSEDRLRWTDADLEGLSWHDNHIHGWSITTDVEEHGTGKLALDIDHIVEWLTPADAPWCFRVAPATLTFHGVSSLRVEIDYERVSAGIVPPSIEEIERQTIEYPGGQKAYTWSIELNWPAGRFSFKGAGFTLELRSPPQVRDHQCLEPSERA